MGKRRGEFRKILPVLLNASTRIHFASGLVSHNLHREVFLLIFTMVETGPATPAPHDPMPHDNNDVIFFCTH